jgi:hypothetical protein
MTPRDDVETVALNSVVLVRCPVCKSIHAAVPCGEVIRDQGAFRQKVTSSPTPTEEVAPCLLCLVAGSGVRLPDVLATVFSMMVTRLAKATGATTVTSGRAAPKSGKDTRRQAPSAHHQSLTPPP